MKDQAPSIRTRLLVSNIGVVLVAFIIVIVSFNLIIDRYVEKSTEKHLSQVVAAQNSTADLPLLNEEMGGEFDLRPKVIHLSDLYEVMKSPGVTDYDISNAKAIASVLESENVSLEDLRNQRVTFGGKTFYVELAPVSEEMYNLFYVDVTGITNFANEVSLLLFVIAFIVIVISSLSILFITGTITRPLSDLRVFAKRIGKGDFSAYEADFKLREFVQLADNLNETATQLDKVDEDQKVFFENASHELRTPLMSIKSYAEGIKYKVLPLDESVDVILNETDRMTELVEDILTTSRIDKLKENSEMHLQDCRELMQDVIDEQKGLAKKGVEILTEFDKQPVMLEMNYKALRRAVSNLNANALRYAKTKIVFTCQNIDGAVVLSVKNDGEQIEAQDLEHLFERFYKGKGGVHGIGLAIVKSVAEQHAGTVDVTSEPEETCFTMTFKKN